MQVKSAQETGLKYASTAFCVVSLGDYLSPNRHRTNIIRRQLLKQRLTRSRTADPPTEQRDWSISDLAMVALFGGAPSLAGVSVTETTALGLRGVVNTSGSGCFR
jgi:hypothetical protein